MKRLFLLLLSYFFFIGLSAQGDYQMYAHLYEGCIDDEESPIYGGSYSGYPKNLVDAQFPGGDVELSLYIHKNTERQ